MFLVPHPVARSQAVYAGTGHSVSIGALKAWSKLVNLATSSTDQSLVRAKNDVPRRSSASRTRAVPAAVRETFTARRSDGR
jgi:hypothetical protein